ncbi:class I SAM-dependent methyltransferase [Pseudoruegeria sp. SHC-113]|uniref:class I SAM-dependent methyltransferase n=1 Tax=Pseudoruegeria sp. SHC-113 TaxID=2855439 RepID=UPI0021BB4CC8|nr:class I SAM-dependent methyltransferase [Pseudoruegeria sp. SHC-113]MCT8161199.1 DUF938 domain-containing protein [Pseudoruegeria sp. SHC-113]
MAFWPRLKPDDRNIRPHEAPGQYIAPAASRNEAPILAVLKEVLPETGRALEIASGTGQHIAACAAQHPGLHWQPSDIEDSRLASIAQWVAESGRENLAPPIRLDATRAPYAGAPYDVILLVNLLHLISEDDCWAILTHAAAALNSGGLFCFYGPFLRESGFASEGDRAFHMHLQGIDPGVGYKQVRDLQNWLASRGFTLEACHEMPANNLMWICRKG